MGEHVTLFHMCAFIQVAISENQLVFIFLGLNHNRSYLFGSFHKEHGSTTLYKFTETHQVSLQDALCGIGEVKP